MPPRPGRALHGLRRRRQLLHKERMPARGEGQICSSANLNVCSWVPLHLPIKEEGQIIVGHAMCD